MAGSLANGHLGRGWRNGPGALENTLLAQDTKPLFWKEMLSQASGGFLLRLDADSHQAGWKQFLIGCHSLEKLCWNIVRVNRNGIHCQLLAVLPTTPIPASPTSSGRTWAYRGLTLVSSLRVEPSPCPAITAFWLNWRNAGEEVHGQFAGHRLMFRVVCLSVMMNQWPTPPAIPARLSSPDLFLPRSPFLSRTGGR